jgi:DNA-binding CsgD family transcriptional regulator/transcriptional regulator with XRE-family HTH domain/tetratricopeptide (TPR) repeat protein
MASQLRPTFADLLRRHRQRAGLTQEELAERAGLSVRGVSDLERGVRQWPRPETADRLADALGLLSDERESFAGISRSPRSPPPRHPISPLPPRSPPHARRTADRPHAFICPILIGRERELEILRGRLASASTGGAVFLLGDPGVGKTRLVTELLATSEAAELSPIRVACLESERAEPYSLILQIAELAGLSADLFPGQASTIKRRVRQIGQTLRTSLARRAAGKPLVLAIDDLQWSDQSSLEVLLSLVERPDNLVLLATLRPDPLPTGVASFLAETNRLRVSTELVVRPLERADVARMIYATLDVADPLPGPLVDDVMAASAGYPFLVEEFCRSLLESGAIELGPDVRYRPVGIVPSVPRALRHAVEVRLAKVSSDAVKVAELSAALGPVVDLRLLGGLSGLGEESILAALRELDRAQILSSDPNPHSSGLAFRHALTRDALLGRLLPPERQHLHRGIALLLESDPETTPALLAFHWSRAGDLPRAARHALLAGERAARMHAHRDAITHFEVALAGGAEPRGDILTALGDHHAALGERELAVARYEQARQICGARGDPVRDAELELRIGTCFARERQRNEAIGHLQSAWAGLPVHHPERWSAGLWLALQLASRGDYPESLAVLEEADAAASGAEPIARLRIAYEISGIRAMLGDWDALDRAGTRVLREASGDSDDALALRYDAHAALGTLACHRGAFDLAWEHFRASRLLADQRGQAVDRATSDWNIAGNVLHHLGRWAEARATLAELAATAPRWLAALARMLILWQDGRWEEAADVARRSWPDYERDSDLEVQIGFMKWLLDLGLAREGPQEGLAWTQLVLDRIRARGAAGYAILLVRYEAAALVLQRDPRAREVLEAGLARADHLGARREVAMLLRIRALAHRESGNWSEAFADCEAAGGILRELAMPYEYARTLRQGALLRLARSRRGDREHAATDLQAARRRFAELGAHRDAAAVDAIVSASGLGPLAQRARQGLSSREHEVAVAVTEGLTNAQIAARLYIAEHTVAHHVGAILDKLGVNSRAQIAAFVARTQVLDEENPRNPAG